MSDYMGITDLQALHEVAWTNIEGAYVKVKQEVSDDPMGLKPERHTEIREGTIAGRHKGWHLEYIKGEGNIAEPGDNHIVINTPEDTYLEVRTDKLENELLEFKPTEND